MTRDRDAHLEALVLPNDMSAIGQARRWVAARLAERAIAPARCDDAVLVASELVTNAVRHGDGRIVAHLTVRRDDIELAVTDEGDGVPAIRLSSFSPAGGLGLRIVERLSAAWGVRRAERGKTVWAVLAA